ncbi:MAG: hypothetical protein IRZ32_03705, partial [Solirubrobacteraceae bacterium]|nr:hypothetical protein [Solirubrobacteraceae bacterium]
DDAPPPAADPPAAEGDEDPAAAEGGEDGEDGAPEASPPAGDAPRPREAEAPAPLPGFAPAAAGDARPSRLGGVLLIGGLVVVIVVVAVILLGGGDSDGGTVTSTQGGATATQAATEATTPTTGELTVEAQVNMRAPGGGDALGVAQIITDGATRGVSVTAEGLEPNGEQDRYALWLTGGPGGKAYLLGFSTTAVTRNGRFGGSAELPEDADDYRRIELSRETRDDPRTPTEVVLRGSFRTR